MTALDLAEGAPVILYLHSPKERVWGLLLSLQPAGVVVRGLDLVAFDDWMRQLVRHEETVIGLTTVFYPMGRVERMERDETVGPLTSYADRFLREVGRTVGQVLGLDRLSYPPSKNAPARGPTRPRHVGPTRKESPFSPIPPRNRT